MKIALVVRHYDRRGGISRYTAELAEHFADDHEVHVFTASWQDVRDNRIIFHKVPLLSFSFLKKRKKHALNNIFEVASFALFSCWAVRKGTFDIVHAQGDFLGNPDVYTAHSCHKAWLAVFNEEKQSALEHVKKSIFNPLHFVILSLEKHFVRKAKTIIAVSKSVKGELVKYYRVTDSKIKTIPNGVDIERFTPGGGPGDRSNIRTKYGINDDEFVIIFPAHEFRRKGLVQVLEALRMLNTERIRVLVIGKDDPSFFLKQYAGMGGRLTFAGEVQEIEKYFAASDLMVFPTAYEPFGLVILEGLAAGLPVITTMSAGAEELIEDGSNGFLLRSPNDIAMIAQKIKFVYEHKEEAIKIGAAARKTAEKYSWKKIAADTSKVYTETIEDRSL
jgi:UDP-glucose:(heptosyl)LPS alpha-1,3-glucosyltransferase